MGKLTERALRAKHRVNPCVRRLLDRERASAVEPSRFWLGSAAAPAGTRNGRGAKRSRPLKTASASMRSGSDTKGHHSPQNGGPSAWWRQYAGFPRVLRPTMSR